jgi:uncharacterized CHY-type Zn-finger protein
MLRHLFKKFLTVFLVFNIPVHVHAAQELFCQPIALNESVVLDRQQVWEGILNTMKLKRYGVYSVATLGAAAGIYYTFFYNVQQPAGRSTKPAVGATASDDDIARALLELKRLESLSGWEGLKYEAGRSFMLALSAAVALTVAKKISPAFDKVATTFLNQCGFAADLLIKQCTARAIDQSVRLNRNIKVAQSLLMQLDVNTSVATMLTRVVADDLTIDILSQIRACEELYACFNAHAELGLISQEALQACDQHAASSQQLINQCAERVAVVTEKIRRLDSTMRTALDELNVLHDACVYATVRFVDVFTQAAYGA